MPASGQAIAGTALTQRDSKDVPQFAPNFTVYVLPPDVVCLYSEDRKFFLHGELYCALASAIGAGKSVRAARSRAGAGFSVRQDRRSPEAADRPPLRRPGTALVRGRRGRLLGEPRPVAGDREETISRNVVCAFKSIDVQGAKELGAALEGAGRSHREGLRRPDGHAGERLSRSATGRIEPAAFVGPARPGCSSSPPAFFPWWGRCSARAQSKSACWTCLAERMKRNREVKAFLDRRQARRVAASPLARDAFGQKRHPACGRRDRESDRHRLSHRLARSPHQPRPVGLDHRAGITWRPARNVRPAAARSCAIPRRAPAPVELGAGGKLVMTSGGYRAVSPGATVARFRKHVSPLTGVVSRLERIEADLPLNTNYLATHNFSAPPRDGRRAQGRTERRQLRQGQHCRAGRSQRADGGDRALFRNFSGRRDQSDAAVHGFPAGRRHSSERRLAVQRRAATGGIWRRRPTRTRRRRCRLHSIHRPRSNGRRSGRCATNASSIFRPACCISSTAALAATRSTRIPTAARPATRSRKPSSRDSSSWWNAMPTQSGGTTDCSGRKWTSTSSTIPTSAICKPSLPKPDAAFGCSTSPAISGFRAS